MSRRKKKDKTNKNRLSKITIETIKFFSIIGLSNHPKKN